MKNDGNLVVYDSYNQATCSSNTHHKGAKPHRLFMQNGRNLIIYDEMDTQIGNQTLGYVFSYPLQLLLCFIYFFYILLK